MGTTLLRHQIDPAPHGAHQFTHDGQTDPAALARRWRDTLPLDEWVENTLLILLGNTRPLVDALEAPQTIDLAGRQPHLHP